MKKGRVTIPKTRAFHYNTAVDECHICGKGATHSVIRMNRHGKIVPGTSRLLYLCTEHFVQMFKVPANRFPKQAKKKIAPVTDKKREFILRRHMDVPIVLQGTRLTSHHVMLGKDVGWFFALYEEGPDLVVSLTRAYSKKYGVHMIQRIKPLLESDTPPVIGVGMSEVIEQTKFLIHSHGTVAPVDDSTLLMLTIHATIFFEKCENEMLSQGAVVEFKEGETFTSPLKY